MKAFFTRLYAAVDARDLMLVAGLGLCSLGAHMMFPPAAYVLPGAVLTGVAIFGVRR